MIPADSTPPDVVRPKSIAEIPVPEADKRPLSCPVGITSYREAVRDCYYVDKTLLLREMIDDRNKVYLFTRPRRFGKTLTTDMIKTYFELSEEDTSVYFQDKKIWACGESYRKFQGAYPVIHLSFKDAHQDNWDSMYQSLLLTIRTEFRRHRELLNSDALLASDKEYFTSILNAEMKPINCQIALSELSYMLYQHYQRKVVILIDEYDTPIQQGHLHGYYDAVVNFMRNLLSGGLKDNDHLAFGALTGILRIAKESIFSGLNNLVVNTILDERYAQYFGFTTEEIQQMAQYYGKEDCLEELREWYDGYLFGSCEIYNPWSVINYFDNGCKPKAFWSRSSSNDIVAKFVQNGSHELYESLTSLLQGSEIMSLIDTDIIYPEITDNPNTIYSFLLLSGYLKVTHVISDARDMPLCSLRIPNREIQNIFRKEIIDQFSGVFSVGILQDFELALRGGNTMLFQNTLSQFLLNSASFHDTSQETFYHGLMLGMLSILSDDYYVTSNRESGGGRFDIQLEPKDISRPGYILEFKAKSNLNDEQLEDLAKTALEQIVTNQYASDLYYHGIKEVQIYGVAFSGKKASVKTKTIQRKSIR